MKNLIDWPDCKKQTPLQLACACLDADCITALLSAGASPIACGINSEQAVINTAAIELASRKLVQCNEAKQMLPLDLLRKSEKARTNLRNRCQLRQNSARIASDCLRELKLRDLRNLSVGYKRLSHAWKRLLQSCMDVISSHARLKRRLRGSLEFALELRHGRTSPLVLSMLEVLKGIDMEVDFPFVLCVDANGGDANDEVISLEANALEILGKTVKETKTLRLPRDNNAPAL